jgi:RNA polymerase sigma-70 factor (ECF subfamily)
VISKIFGDETTSVSIWLQEFRNFWKNHLTKTFKSSSKQRFMSYDQTQIELAKQGDQAAFRHIVERYQDYVYSICLTLLKDRHLAQEAAQDSFVKVYKSLRRFQKDSKFSTWLYTLVYRTCLDYLKKKKRHTEDIEQQFNLTSAEDSIQESMEQNERSELLHDAIRRLPEFDRRILELYYLQGLNIGELSEIMGLKENNIKVRLYRSRKLLREELTKSKYAELTNEKL